MLTTAVANAARNSAQSVTYNLFIATLHLGKFTVKQTVNTATTAVEFFTDKIFFPAIATIGTAMVVGGATAVSSYFWPAAKQADEPKEKTVEAKEEKAPEQTAPSLANSIN